MSDSDHKDSGDTSPPKKKFKPDVLHEDVAIKVAKKKFKPDVLLEDVAIKVDDKIYHLNRVQLALNSHYFEKLFVEDFAEKNNDVIEIQAFNSDTFSAIVDLINGKNLESVMNADNYVGLFTAMDYLQMEIDLTPVKKFIPKTTSIVETIQLYNLVTANQNYQYLEEKVLWRISALLVEINKHDKKFIRCLPFEQFFKTIRTPEVMWCEFHGEKTVQAKGTLSQICSSWICHDVENRIQHFTAIVNAANYGFYTESFLISDEKVGPLLEEIKKDNSQERIEKCFQKLLSYRGEINPDVGQFKTEEESLDERDDESENEKHIVNKIDESEVISRFLKEGILSDVTIKAGTKTYKLHRYILATATTYFSDPNPNSNENPQFVIDIDEKTFDLIVDFIYFDKIPKFDSNSKTEIMQMLKAATILNSKLVMKKCFVPFVREIEENLSSEDFIELINSIGRNSWQSENWVESVTYSLIRLVKKGISKDILRLWKICEDAGLKDISFNYRDSIMEIIDDMNDENLLKTFDTIREANDAGKYSFYIECLCKLIVASKSELSVESHFVSVSCNVLEDLLASDYFIVSDPQKIIDICSKWIVHDIENRYRLIPRIVFAINCNNFMNLDDFESNIPTDLSNCSQKDINDELWRLLNSNCLLSRDVGPEPTSWNIKTRPMFILPKNVDEETLIPSEVCVVDSELNEMVSLNFLLNHYDVAKKWDRRTDPKLSATLIGDTLFILCEIRYEFRVYAYNFSSKKLNVLASPHRPMYYPMDTLLNCNNQLFWCFDDGRVMKYSIELNRWLQIYTSSAFSNHGPYSSDGKKLFRHHDRVIEVFDFERSSWTHFANPPSFSGMSNIRPCRMISFHNGIAFGYTPLFSSSIALFDSDTRRWREVFTPAGHNSHQILDFNVQLVPYGKDLVFADKKGVHQLSRESFTYGGWLLKKRASSESHLVGIMFIHSIPYPDL